MLDFNLTNAYSPMLFSQNGNKVVVMPMLSDKANAEAKADREAKGEAEQAEPFEVRGESGEVPEPVTPTEPATEQAEPVAEPVKARRKRKQAVKV